MIPIPKGWKADLEGRMSDFGRMYRGYYFEMDDVIYVGYVGVLEEYRNNGHFKAILQAFKDKRRGVVLYSPTFMTRRLAERFGYVYDNFHNCMVWERGE